MASSDTDSDVNWMQCEPIERIPGKVSGRSIVCGTRIMPDPIVNSYDLDDSIEEIQEGFPTLPVEQITRLIQLAPAQRGQPQL